MKSIDVACPHCKASVRSRCVVVGTSVPLALSVAHPSRMEAAGLLPVYSAVAKARELWAEDVKNGHRPASI